MPTTPFPSSKHQPFSHDIMACRVCFKIVPSLVDPAMGQCIHCGRQMLYLHFIEELERALKGYEDSGLPPHASHIHVDLGSMPQDIIFMKAQIEQMEKALSAFSEILKDALQT